MTLSELPLCTKKVRRNDEKNETQDLLREILLPRRFWVFSEKKTCKVTRKMI